MACSALEIQWQITQVDSPPARQQSVVKVARGRETDRVRNGRLLKAPESRERTIIEIDGILADESASLELKKAAIGALGQGLVFLYFFVALERQWFPIRTPPYGEIGGGRRRA